MTEKRRQLRVLTLAAVFISLCTASIALGKEDQQLPGKEPVVFEKYSCKLMLPSEKWRWPKPPDLEKGKGFIVHDGVADVTLKIQPTNQDTLTDIYARNVESGFLRVTGGKKIGSRKITYQGQLCYEFTAFVSIVNAEATTRVFIAGGFLYSLTASIPPNSTPLISVSDIFDKCFEFTGTGTIAPEKSQDADSQADSEYEEALETIDRRALWIGLPVLVVGAGILILLRRKRTKA